MTKPTLWRRPPSTDSHIVVVTTLRYLEGNVPIETEVIQMLRHRGGLYRSPYVSTLRNHLWFDFCESFFDA